MAAAGQSLRESVELQPNRPEEIALRFPTGKLLDGNFGKRVMFSLVDDRVLFLDLAQADKINALQPRPGETFFVRLDWSGRRGEPKQFVAWLSPDTEKRRALVEAQRAGDSWNAKKLQQALDKPKPVMAPPIGTPVGPGDASSIVQRAAAAAAKPPAGDRFWAETVLGRAGGLMDIYVKARKYAERFDGAVSDEDVRWFVAAAFIGEAKRGSK